MFGAEISILCRIRKKGSVIIGEVLTTEVIHRVFRQGLYVYMYVAGKSSGRGTTVSSAPTRKRPSALFGLWCLTTVFASATADAETDGKCHRGQARRARQEPDALRFEREIGVFPALALTVIKNYKRHDLDAYLGESVGFMERSDSGTE